jgi:hypothetical protein
MAAEGQPEACFQMNTEVDNFQNNCLSNHRLCRNLRYSLRLCWQKLSAIAYCSSFPVSG